MRFLYVAAVAFITFAIVLLYGKAMFNAGVAKSAASCIATAAEAGEKAKVEFEKINHEVKNKTDSDVDSSLRALGIMRDQEDR